MPEGKREKEQHERRQHDRQIKTVMHKLDANTQDIAGLQSQLNTLATTLYRQSVEQTDKITILHNAVEPIEHLLEDVAAVGRAGKLIKVVTGWVVVVGGGFMAAYEYIHHLTKIK